MKSERNRHGIIQAGYVCNYLKNQKCSISQSCPGIFPALTSPGFRASVLTFTSQLHKHRIISRHGHRPHSRFDRDGRGLLPVAVVDDDQLPALGIVSAFRI